MANPTTNYGFVLPTPTDLVTDLPADFDVALQGVDTQLKALQPGTTLGDLAYSSATANTNTRLGIGTSGQVLAVSGGGVPAWTTTADVTPLTTKGDLFTFTTADARIGVGANGTILTADSAEATGLKWVAAASTPTISWVLLGSSTGLSSGSEVSYTGLSGYNRLQIIYYNISSTAASYARIRFNSDTANNYLFAGQVANDTSGTASGISGDQSAAASALLVSYGVAANNHDGFLYMEGSNSTAPKIGHFIAGVTTASGNLKYSAGFKYSGSAVISSLQIAVDGGTFDSGEVLLYGSVA